jgi:glutamine synthetase type III
MSRYISIVDAIVGIEIGKFIGDYISYAFWDNGDPIFIKKRNQGVVLYHPDINRCKARFRARYDKRQLHRSIVSMRIQGRSCLR